MSTWSSLVTKQKTYEITKLLPETEYTVSINGTYNEPIEVWLTTLITDENGIVETGVNQDNSVYVGDLEHNKLTFTAQESHTALVIRPLGDLELTSIQLEKGTLETDWVPAPEDFNTIKGVRYNLSQPLKKDQYYTLSFWGGVDGWVGAWLGDDVPLGYLKDNKLTFKLTEQFNHDHITLKSLSEIGTVSEIKLEQGSNPDSTWTPAWEDLPIEDKPVSFIETSGGTDINKYDLIVVEPSIGGITYQFGGKFKNVGDSNLVIHSNISALRDVSVHETIELDGIAIGDGISNLVYSLRTKNISDSLSFYAYNPSVYETEERYFSGFSLTDYQKPWQGYMTGLEPSDDPNDYIWGLSQKEVGRVINENNSRITANTEAIILEKSEREIQYGTLFDTITEQGSSLTLLNDQVNIEVAQRLTNAEGVLENINESISTVESTQQTFTNRITNLEGEMIEQQTFFRTGMDGLTIGGTDWETVMHVDGERIRFQSQAGNVKAHFGAGGMYVNRWETDFHTIEKFEEGSAKGTIFKNRKGGS